MLLQDLADLVYAGIPIRKPCLYRGFVLIKSLDQFKTKCTPEDCLAEDWEPWPRNERERKLLLKLRPAGL